ncbi:unnamed protein product [Ranitomeya imitator]|uniref:3'-5' exonuclease domain-containing protein n=1 Tax=Ranitomeya imitator TaxID=111125 RepID=A0ABN9LNF9_9NEOB|nr:unnamed protein product [Ranitomeya imitator]
MCAPLLLLDRFNLLEAYVSGHPELQSQLLQMLDRWSDSSFNLRKLSKEYVGIPPVKPDKLNLKTLSKLAFRLLETNNLDPALCTNIINQRHLGTLKYLMYKRFVEGKHRVTKRRAALSNPMFTLVTIVKVKKNNHYILTYRCLSPALCFSALAVSTAAGKQSGDVTAVLSRPLCSTARAEKHSARGQTAVGDSVPLTMVTKGKHRVTKRGPALSNPMFTLVTGIVGRWRAVCVTALQRPNSDAAAIRIVVSIAAASLSVTKTMTQENWVDHVQNTVAGNLWLQEQCIALLCRYSGLQAAGFWALKFGMPKESLPRNVADILQDISIQEMLSESEKNTGDSQARRNHFYQLPIPRSKVHFLQNSTELSGCRVMVLKDGQIVGVDMEWRPSFGGLGKPNVSLIQLAVKDEVFLLDVLQGNLLQSCDSGGSSELVTFMKDCFLLPKLRNWVRELIMVSGYGMVGDFQSLDATDAGFQGLELHNVVDLCEVHKQIQRNCSRPRGSSEPVDVLEDSPGNASIRPPEKGLSLLVKDVLGKPLDKKEQLSNWDKRPLREDQIVYAASDAYCLLDVFETLCHTPDKFGLKPNFYEFPKGKVSPKKDVGRSPCQKESVLKNKRLQTPPKAVSPKNTPQTKPLTPREFSVICDNMLQGLGRYLRCLGVDVLMLENDDDHRKASEIARRDGRVILTCGQPYQTLRSQIGEGKCFSVNCSEKAKEQAIEVLKHFNVSVSLADVFSRCQGGTSQISDLTVCTALCQITDLIGVQAASQCLL